MYFLYNNFNIITIIKPSHHQSTNLQKKINIITHNLFVDPSPTNEEELKETKGAIRIYKSKDKHHNGQKKKYKRTNNDLQNIHIQLKIE